MVLSIVLGMLTLCPINYSLCFAICVQAGAYVFSVCAHMQVCMCLRVHMSMRKCIFILVLFPVLSLALEPVPRLLVAFEQLFFQFTLCAHLPKIS